MMVSKFLKKNKKKPQHVIVEISSYVKDYSEADFFVKKAEEAKQMLAKFGYPKELTAAK